MGISNLPDGGRSGYAEALDGVRALCIILTVVAHIETLPLRTNGIIGVDIFFALSGWLITTLLLREHESTGTISLRSFYVRRFLRIVPLYLLTAFGYVLAAEAAYVLKNDSSFLQETGAALPYILTFNGEYQVGAHPTFYHAWTLGIEEKFYIMWPLLAALMMPHFRSAAVAAALLAVAVVTLWPLDSVIRGYVGIGSGTVTALIAHRHRHVQHLLTTSALAAPCMAGIAVVDTLSLDSVAWIMWNITVSFLASILIASLWHNRSQAVSRMLSQPALVWLGKLTFAVYLIHVLILNVLTEVGATSPWFLLLGTYALSVLCAFVLSRVVEQPMIGIGRKLARSFRQKGNQTVLQSS